MVQTKKLPLQNRGSRLRDTISRHFEHINCSRQYLTHLANVHPSQYVALVSKCIPQEVALEITAHVIDLGAEILRAQSNLARLNADMVDITPTLEPPLTVPPSTLSPPTEQPLTHTARVQHNTAVTRDT